jgi:hypothetical protein
LEGLFDEATYFPPYAFGTTISPASFNSGGKAFNSKVIFQSDGSYVSDGTCTIVDSIYHNSKTPFIQHLLTIRIMLLA